MIRCGSAKATRVCSPSAKVAISSSTSVRERHARYAAGAALDCTPITSIRGLTALATTQAPAAPLPPPTGTRIASSSGSRSSISSVAVPTPAIRYGSSPEWM